MLLRRFPSQSEFQELSPAGRICFTLKKKFAPAQSFAQQSIAQNELTIRTSKTDEVCRLVDVFGSTIIDCIRIEKEVKINVDELKSGVYFIVSNTAESVKFIKQ